MVRSCPSCPDSATDEPASDTTSTSSSTSTSTDLPLPIEVLVLLVLMVAAAAVLFLSKRDVKQKGYVTFIGLPNSGKTALWFRYFRGCEVKTQTSMIANEEATTLGGKARTVVDYPGHLKLRHAASSVIHKSSALIFCVDSIDWEANLSSNAEYLVAILTDPEVVLTKPKTKLCIACTKRDVGHSYKASFILTRLEQEIEKIRQTKVHSVTGMGEAQTLQLGIDGEKFSFKNNSPLETTCVDVSATEDRSDAPLWAWMNKSA